MLMFFSYTIYSQTNTINSILWTGNKRMNEKFMSHFIETKVGSKLDSIKIIRDIAALTRLNGISNVTFEINPSYNFGYEVNFKIIENFSILPNLSLWTTDATAAAYRIGLYDYNFLGRNNTVGGFYQNNGVSSFGFNFSAPFLFSANLGIETSYQRLSSIEPIFINNLPAEYQYTNTGFELLGVYRLNYRNSIKLGTSFFNEFYKYRSGATSPDVPLDFKVDKILYKSNYNYNNLKYDFYLVSGFKNDFFGQFVTSNNKFQNDFVIVWNDLSYFRRIGKTGNWASRLRLGLSTNSDSPFAPFTLDNNLNIRGVGNIIDRGTGIITLNTEFRKTLYEKNWFVIQGNVFIDSGSWRRPGGDFSDFVNSDNFRVYPGLGLRFIHKTIFNATFRIDYGYGITKNASNGIVFGIGQYF